jgi:deoxyadenosine/deoxycytidine kinase
MLPKKQASATRPIAIGEVGLDYHYEGYNREAQIKLFEQMLQMVRLPDLMIYLRASVPHLVGNIQQRGRDYEQTMQLEYLENLNRRYDEFLMQQYRGRLLVVEKDPLDFEHQPKDFAKIVDRIDSTLFGLFPPTDNWPLNPPKSH